MSILLFGEATSDYLLLADEFPSNGCGILLGEKELPGGGALNTAITLNGWKIPVLLAGNPIGKDVLGRKIFAYLKNHQIPHQISILPNIQTSRCICLVNKKEKSRSFLISPPLHSKKFSDSKKIPYSSFTHAFVDPYLGKRALEVLKNLQETDSWILIQDISPHSDALGMADGVQLSLSLEEFSMGNWTEKAKPYLEGRTKWVIFTGGEKGVVCVGLDQIIKVKSYFSQVVDTTGCGDAFRAGFLYGLYHGFNIKEALHIGCWAGAKTGEFLGGHGVLDWPPF